MTTSTRECRRSIVYLFHMYIAVKLFCFWFGCFFIIHGILSVIIEKLATCIAYNLCLKRR